MTASIPLLLACILPCLTPRTGDDRDTVVLKGGKELRGRVILELADRVVLLVGTREMWIERSKIQRISTIQAALRGILDKFDDGSDKPEELIALAEACGKAGLPHEERLFYWAVLVGDPSHAVANARLGHRQSGATWRVPVDGSWRPLGQAERIHAEWGKARRLRSEHFELRTDAGLQTAVHTLLELESFYRHLFDLFQRDLELREVLLPIQVHLYKDGEAFPRLSNNVDAYFSKDVNILFSYLDDKRRPHSLFHQATHATIYNLGGSRRGRRTELPGWLNEGWADYMEGILEPDKGGRLKLDLKRRVGYRIGNLAAEKKPYSLRRVLNFKETDFFASSKQELKYAQAYALTLLLMEGNGGKYTDRFLKYMKQSLGGKGSSSVFRGVFRQDLEAIERDHLKMK